MVTGELVRETPQEVTLRWDYGEATFTRQEIRQFVKSLPSVPKEQAATAEASTGPHHPPSHQATLYLGNGGVITGELLYDLPDQVILHVDAGDVGFKRTEIQQLVTGQPEAKT